MTKELELKRLTDFFDKGSVKNKTQASEDDPLQRKVSDFGICCPYCSSYDVISRGLRKNKRKGPVQVYYCKKCKRKFTLGVRGQLPWWATESILSLCVEGVKPSVILQKVKDEGEIRDEPINVCKQTIFNIIKRHVEIFLDFEEDLRHRHLAKEWQIDDTPQIFPKSKDLDYPMGEKCLVWITNVLADTYYWFASQVSPTREAEDSERALEKAVERAKYTPLRIRCDGYRGHIRAIKKVMPHTYVDSKTKKMDFGHINLVESLHSSMRRKAIKKRGFRSVENLQYLVDLFRIYWNFLKRFDALVGLTPAAKAGSAPVFRGWADFIDYVCVHPRSA